MHERADAHIHLFKGGFHGSFAGRRGVKLDEPELYGSLAEEHFVARALVVGYAAEPWCTDNNRWLSPLARGLPWADPLAYFETARPPVIARLEQLRSEGFVGLATYVFDPEAAAAVRRLPDSFLRWMTEQRWLLSVNSRGDYWRAWEKVLEQFGDLRILVSHLGLPERGGDLSVAMDPVLRLSAYPGPRVKLSGFYALSDPSSDYPHPSVWQCVEALIERFGTNRLLWGSDFSPSLDHVSFAQTYGLFGHMPFLDDPARWEIEGENLLSLLSEIERRQ